MKRSFRTRQGKSKKLLITSSIYSLTMKINNKSYVVAAKE